MKNKKGNIGMGSAGAYKDMGPNGQLPNMGYDKSKSTPQSQGNSIDMGGYPSKGVNGGSSSPRK